MGKIRETFRLIADEMVATATAPPDEPEPAPPEEEAPIADMPFIEIGPRREMQASADVLACPGPPRRAAVAAPPRGVGVAFRTLPAGARRSRFAPELVAYHAPNQPASAQYAALLTTIAEAAAGRGGHPDNVYLFSGVRAGAGTTTVVLNLAITAARAGKSVLVTDANLRRPAVAGRVGLESHPGLTEVLNGDAALASAVRPTGLDNLSVLASGAPAALWADPASLRELLAELSRMADLVMIDGPAWDGRGAAAGLAPGSGAVFLVVPDREADEPQATGLLAALPAKGVPLAGCILTEA
jgi:Mrp family chromosome partitioning ATPase